MDCICGKRLVGVIGELIPVLEEHGEIELDATTREKLLKISASTIDRVLAPERKRLLSRKRSRTEPWDTAQAQDTNQDLLPVG